ncbi:MAG: stage III sporulation protein AC [Eubacterium sp.]|nr:stage III sporulation protein AC [Eubacterium sp.]
MDISLIFKIAAIGIIVALLHTLLVRSGRDDQAMLVTLAGVIVVMTMLIPQISALFRSVRDLFDLSFRLVLWR